MWADDDSNFPSYIYLFSPPPPPLWGGKLKRFSLCELLIFLFRFRNNFASGQEPGRCCKHILKLQCNICCSLGARTHTQIYIRHNLKLFYTQKKGQPPTSTATAHGVCSTLFAFAVCKSLRNWLKMRLISPKGSLRGSQVIRGGPDAVTEIIKIVINNSTINK